MFKVTKDGIPQPKSRSIEDDRFLFEEERSDNSGSRSHDHIFKALDYQFIEL
jgi:hypothetical protein